MNKLEEYKSKINYDVWEDLMWSSLDEQKKIELKKLMKKEFWDEENGGESWLMKRYMIIWLEWSVLIITIIPSVWNTIWSY